MTFKIGKMVNLKGSKTHGKVVAVRRHQIHGNIYGVDIGWGAELWILEEDLEPY